jgi:hypothetical protein
MTNKRYEFDNRKPNVMFKIGSTLIAVSEAWKISALDSGAPTLTA